MQTIALILQNDNRIILNCTYNKEKEEAISQRNIKWQKQIGDEFKDIAVFSPPGGQKPFIEKKMQNFYNNRTELIGPNTSLAAVMIIKDPVCGDGGTYRCWIQYYSESSIKEKTNQTVVEFDCKYIFIIYVYIYFFLKLIRTTFENLNSSYREIFLKQYTYSCLFVIFV